MPIKKTELERKWYYRVLKVFFIILPIVLLLLLLFRYRNITCTVVPPGIPDPFTLALIIAALVLYYPLLRLLRWAALYLIYGGVVDDLERGPVSPAAMKTPPSKTAQIVPLILLIIILVLGALIATGRITLPKLTTTNRTMTPGSTCPATSAETATPCGSVSGGVGVSGVIVPARCSCPSDTTYASMDNVTIGGPYRICTCK